MNSGRNSKAGHRLERTGHVLAGILILLKSSIAAEHHPWLGLLLLILGLTFICVAVLHHKVEQLLPVYGQQILYALEGCALVVVAYEMVAQHKKYLQYAFGFSAALYFIVAIAFPYLRKLKDRRMIRNA